MEPQIKKVTVRMLEAHFKALPILIDFLKRESEAGNPSATRTLKKFIKEAKNEPGHLDQSEAIFGFAAMLTSLRPGVTVGAEHDASIMAELAMLFCNANELGPPSPGYQHRLNMPATSTHLVEEK